MRRGFLLFGFVVRERGWRMWYFSWGAWWRERDGVSQSVICYLVEPFFMPSVQIIIVIVYRCWRFKDEDLIYFFFFSSLTYLLERMQKTDKSRGAIAISSSIIAAGLGVSIWLETLCEICRTASTMRQIQKNAR